MQRSFLVHLILISACAFACRAPLKEDAQLLVNMMKREPEQFSEFIRKKDSLEIQIIYTQINRDANNRPTFRSFYFNVDSSRYFYPASTVKLPLALIALEKVNQLHIPGLDKYTTMLTDSVYSGHLSVTKDSTAESGMPSIAHYVKKILITSDNDAYNRLYEFMGQRAANEVLQNKGYTIRYLHRFDRALSPDQNRHTEAIRFVRNDTVIFDQPMLVNDSIPKKESILKGIAHIQNDTLVPTPFDFGYKNLFPLTEQQHLLRALLFPQTVDSRRRFNITEDDRKFVLKYMSQLPTETKYPPYTTDTTYFPAYCKFLMFGDGKDPIPKPIRIFNKVGDAYGYLIDNAYIVNFDEGVEFMLSAVIHANTDGIYNDGEYEYKTIGFPFMKDLGQLVYRYELDRKRPKKPDLSQFRFQYDELQSGN
jgi:Beta-lactamase enzyme family